MTSRTPNPDATEGNAEGLDALCERLRRVPVAVMSDVLAAMGLHDRVLASGIGLVGQTVEPFAGPAVCILGDEGPAQPPASGASQPVYQMDRHMTPGCVAVIGSGGHGAGAVIGGNVGLSWKRRGCAGVVTDSGIRDVSEFAALGLPVFAAFVTPLSPKGLWNVSQVGVPVELPGQGNRPVRVAPGDIVHADRDGVVIVPRAHAAQAVADAEIFEAVEKRIQKDLEADEDREAVYARHDRSGHVRRIA